MEDGENPEISDNSALTKDKIVKKNLLKRPDGLKRVTSFIEFLSKVLGLITWQVIVLIAIMMFYAPLRQIADLLPAKLARSNEINVGVLSLKIQEEAKAAGSEELATIITGLSQDAIKWLLNLGNSSYRVIGSDDGGTGIVRNYYLPKHYAVWKELEDKGLIQSDVNLNAFEKYFHSLNPIEVEEPIRYEIPVSTLTQAQIDELLKNSVELSDTGKRAYEIIIIVVADMIALK